MCYFKFLNTTTFYYINLFNITCPPSPEFPFYSKKGPKKKKKTHTQKKSGTTMRQQTTRATVCQQKLTKKFGWAFKC